MSPTWTPSWSEAGSTAAGLVDRDGRRGGDGGHGDRRRVGRDTRVAVRVSSRRGRGVGDATRVDVRLRDGDGLVGGARLRISGREARGGRDRTADRPDARVRHGDRGEVDVTGVRHDVRVLDRVPDVHAVLIGGRGDRRELVDRDAGNRHRRDMHHRGIRGHRVTLGVRRGCRRRIGDAVVVDDRPA